MNGPPPRALSRVGLERDRVTLRKGEPLGLPGPKPFFNLPLAIISLLLSFKDINLFYFSKCVQSLAIKKVLTLENL